MSVYATMFVWETSKQKSTALLALLAIADYADEETGDAFPGIAKLSTKLRMKERNTQTLLRKLEQAGEIVIDENKGIQTPTGRTNRYTLAGYKEWYQEVQKIAPLRKQGVQIPVLRGANFGSQGVQELAPNPSVYPSENPSDKDSASSDAIEQAINDLPLDDLPSVEQSTSPQPPDDTPPPQTKKQIEDKAIADLLKAYLDASGTIQPTIYANKTIRGQALEMHRRGITPGHIQFFIEDLRKDEFWKAKEIKWVKVAGELFPWLAAKPRVKYIIEPAEPLPVLFDENSPPSDYTGLDLEADLRALADTKDMSKWL